jgi:hypothetical protein
LFDLWAFNLVGHSPDSGPYSLARDVIELRANSCDAYCNVRKIMRSKTFTIVCAAAIGWATVTPAFAAPEDDPLVVTADALIMRPALLAGTVAGSAIWVVALPFTAFSKSVKSSAQALVVAPFKATFTRGLGDFDYEKSTPENEIAANY